MVKKAKVKEPEVMLSSNVTLSTKTWMRMLEMLDERVDKAVEDALKFTNAARFIIYIAKTWYGVEILKWMKETLSTPTTNGQYVGASWDYLNKLLYRADIGKQVALYAIARAASENGVTNGVSRHGIVAWGIRMQPEHIFTNLLSDSDIGKYRFVRMGCSDITEGCRTFNLWRVFLGDEDLKPAEPLIAEAWRKSAGDDEAFRLEVLNIFEEIYTVLHPHQ